MTSDQFAALAELLRLRSGTARDCARMALVDGLRTPEAAARAGLSYRQGAAAVKRVRDGMALARRASGL